MKSFISKKRIVIFSILLALIIGIGAYFQISKSDIIPVEIPACYAMGYLDIQQLVDESDVIATITVKDVVKEWGTNSGSIVPKMDYAFEVTEPIYNVEANQQIIVTQPGGFVEMGGKTYLYTMLDDPLIEKGEEYMVFLKKTSRGVFMILGGPQGRFRIIDGKVYTLQHVDKKSNICLIDINGQSLSSFTEQVKNSLKTKTNTP